MFGGLSISAAGMQTSSWNLDTLGQDMANVDTSGFSALLPAQSNLAPGPIYPAGLGASAPSAAVGQGAGAVPDAVIVDTSEGPLTATGQPLDMAIAGPGYFAVAAPGGPTAYTRNGHFTVNPAGMVVNDQGQALLSVQGRPIVLPPGASGLHVGADGVLSVGTAAVAQIGVTLPANAQGMVGSGTGELVASPAAGALAVSAPGTGGAGGIRDGFLEGSNVNWSATLTDMISAERSFQASAQAYKVALDLWTRSNQL